MEILNEFQKIFDDRIVPFLLQQSCISKNKNVYEPVLYTLMGKSNKFRSATCIAAANICKIDIKKVLPIAAVSELVHASIIIQDDIADNNSQRRGIKSSWIKHGSCYSLHSSLYIIPDCIKIISKKGLTKPFLLNLQEVYKQQIKQELLEIEQEIPYREFLKIHLGKTAVGKWSISSPALIAKRENFYHALLSFAENLGDAGSLKNDMEDFIKEGFKDVKSGALTYPIYYYFNKCNIKEKQFFLELFGKNLDIDYTEIKKDFFEKGVYEHCMNKIITLVTKAKKSIQIIPNTKEKDLLITWANSHKQI